MVSAVMGATHGVGWLPSSLVDGLENGEWGRDRALEMAAALVKLDLPSQGLSKDGQHPSCSTSPLAPQGEAVEGSKGGPADDDGFDWLVSMRELAPLLTLKALHAPADHARCLVLACGTSTLSEVCLISCSYCF
jgi:hypothetical protein